MKWQCVLALIGLFAGVVNSWDIAVTMGDQLEFYTNQTKTQSETNTRFGDLRALAYDAVHNMLLFVDKESDNASIFSYHLNNKKLQSLVKKKSRENIQGLAFDPVEGKLFWTDFLHKSIFWTSLRPGAENSVSGNLLLSLPDQYPRAIAVDSCRGYIYWTNADPGKSTIERARLDGSDRKVILNSSSLYTAVSIAVDQRTRRIYWADDKEGSKCSIESADLDGNDRQFVINDIEHIPNSLAVSKDYIYWTDSSWQVIWKVSKDPTRDQIPEKVVTYDRFDQIPIGVAANYAIDDQTKGIAECETLRRLTEYKPAINESFNIPNEASFLCYNGTLEGASCKCNIGFAGEHCEVSLCHNYCFKGICSVTSKGLPVCRCTNGFTGERCENNLCNGHCLNKGTCSMKRDGTPSCQCTEDYRGDRCETIRENNVLVPVKSKETENCNCTSALRSVDGEFVETSDSWDAVRDPIIMVLGVATGLLCLACVVLITKIMQLKKRPRIKKRIIVNKNVTPLTARPDQCEITIENCCNMNICETPCFEPRGTIRPTLRDAKPGKEEKSNLIANMEYPDDY